MRKHSKNTLKVARYQGAHPVVSWVNYPGIPDHPNHKTAAIYLKDHFRTLVGFGIKGGLTVDKKFIESVQPLSHIANMGDAKTLVIHPASTTHQQLTPEEQKTTGVTEDFIRLSIGLEDVEDTEADLDQALRNVIS